MGVALSSTKEQSLQSNEENDYNPFQIPSIDLKSPNDFNGGIAAQGTPPIHYYKKSEFAAMSTERKAAYADGVVRGSYGYEWMIKQLRQIDSTTDCSNNSAVGAVAYACLKTQDQIMIDNLEDWCKSNISNDEAF